MKADKSMAETGEEEVMEKLEMTAVLFPFVCGICFEKFNKIDSFYLHLQAHNQDTSDCFHICNDLKETEGHTSDTKAARSIFQCGSCSKTFFSICTLHKHMQDIYDQGSYEFDQSTNTAFPKGNVGSLCLTKDSSKDDCITIALYNASKASISAELESAKTDVSKTLNTEVKDSCSKPKKGRKGTNPRKIAVVETIPVLENNASAHGCLKFEETIKTRSSTAFDHVSSNKSVKTVKKPRGRPPKDLKVNHPVILKPPKSYSVSSKLKIKTNERKKKNKTIKNHSKEKQEKADVAEEVMHDFKPDIDQVISKADASPVQETMFDASVEEDKHVMDIATNFDTDQTKMKSKHQHMDATVKKRIKKSDMKEKVKQKKVKTLDNDKDGLSALQKRSKKYFYTCEICNKTMGLSHKKRHAAIHTAAMGGKTKPQEFETCDICGKSVVKAGFKMHQALHSDDRPYLCDRCPKAFKLKSNLHHHKQIHEDFKPHSCETCGKRFHRMTDLRFHLRVHTDERPVQCTLCPLRFRKTSTLNIHMKVHRGDKCYQCELCGKAFIRKDYLKRHMVWHNGQASHECEICNKKFMEKGGLQRHVKIHSEERPHVCHLCGKSFVISANLKQHVKKVHNSEKEKKKAALGTVTNNDKQPDETENQSEGASQNLPDLQQFKETIQEEPKIEEKAEYHTLMPRVRELEVPTLADVGQSRNYRLPQQFTSGQPSFYSTGPVGIVQLPYHDGTMMSHLTLPRRQMNEINGDVTRHAFTEQQQAIQTISLPYVVADDTMQPYHDM